jgi:hypothetical protein
LYLLCFVAGLPLGSPVFLPKSIVEWTPSSKKQIPLCSGWVGYFQKLLSSNDSKTVAVGRHFAIIHRDRIPLPQAPSDHILPQLLSDPHIVNV